ncbi:LysM peptidoglycan-binding domain-containing protein [Desulfolutivibrio sulfoxidireducens]|uniref:LysM peptidoglycan-binding domain-containing protein n=1 Tax=Desulfolutivibrio sulfoxidireducens TaxID=2773299 RepID=UPI00159D2AC3|nr:LysM peptidoglycan-binding domain-containing protein [Desulfolutivibrio sulfoxidireducens]QLA17640.1 LysM peptidoglycan-binding domain-containing protein [Desulfolutivibrio sulfoxidireducens]QLA21212.1 LysM peptidoglycan-binding domain-containing protein [Desulfolutivibrio sulfoxidireducens]
MAKSPRLLFFCLLISLALFGTGCLNRPEYEINVTYINDDLLSQEETLAREQLRQTRARYEEALRSGAAAPGGTIEKEFTAAREKCIIIKKEQERRKGRELTTRDIAADPELAIPEPPSKNPRTGSRPIQAPATPETTTPPPDPGTDAAPEMGIRPAASPQKPLPPSSDANVPTPPAYTVVKGDTLGSIAKRVGTDVHTLAQFNALANGNKLTPGQLLKIPPR